MKTRNREASHSQRDPQGTGGKFYMHLQTHTVNPTRSSPRQRVDSRPPRMGW